MYKKLTDVLDPHTSKSPRIPSVSTFEGKTVLTDGRIMVVVSQENDWLDPAPAAIVNLLKKLSKPDIDPVAMPSSLPDLPAPACPGCGGTGYASECPECEGKGVVEFSNDYNSYTVDCETCGGSRHFTSENKITCECCEGSGTVRRPAPFRLAGDTHVDLHYLHKMKEHMEEVVFYPPERHQQVYFTFKHGYGILMPVIT